MYAPDPRGVDDRVRPHPTHASGVDVEHRITDVRCVLVAHHHVTVVFDADLPEHRVAGQAGQVTAALHMGLHDPARTAGPVLVMTDVDEQVVAIGNRGVVVKVGRDARVELVALGLGPLDKTTLVGEPSAGSD